MSALRTLAVAFVLCAALAACSQAPVNRDQTVPLATAKGVDLNRYLGTWFEIARFPNEFERNCVATTAQYTRYRDGSIQVLNRCHKKTLDGDIDVADGRARVIADGKLGVTFFWPFEGDYWILAVADDYSWALVGEPDGRYLWILARTPHVAPELRTSLEDRLKVLGYKTGALYWTPQP